MMGDEDDEEDDQNKTGRQQRAVRGMTISPEAFVMMILWMAFVSGMALGAALVLTACRRDTTPTTTSGTQDEGAEGRAAERQSRRSPEDEGTTTSMSMPHATEEAAPMATEVQSTSAAAEASETSTL